jgi:glutamyl-Q tRNA(Asp) synthetase
LHLGSLFTALASFLDARANKGLWLLRIDDLDMPRNQLGAASNILTTLEAFGLQWDDTVYYQSQHLAEYEAYLTDLEHKQLTYRCECSRKTLADLGVNENATEKSVYPGICRTKQISADIPHAIRVKTEAESIVFYDRLQGQIATDLAAQHGDFILKRKDEITAYQFAVVVDDALQKINHVVRGCDLLEETPKQIYLQQLLDFPTPAYLHVPVIVDHDGYKLSKQTLATAVDTESPNKVLYNLLMLLKQNPPEEINGATVNESLDWAIEHWRPDALRLCFTILA